MTRFHFTVNHCCLAWDNIATTFWRQLDFEFHNSLIGEFAGTTGDLFFNIRTLGPWQLFEEMADPDGMTNYDEIGYSISS